MRLIHDSAAEDDPLRRERADEVDQRQGEVLRFQYPGRMVRLQFRAGPSPAAFDGRAGREAFQAVAVKGANAGKRVRRQIVRQPDVTHLGMDQPVHQLSADKPAAADAGADRQVQERVQPLRRAPLRFAHRGHVDVRVEADLQAQFSPQHACELRVPPTGFGRGRDVAERRRSWIRVDRSERRDADGRHPAVAAVCAWRKKSTDREIVSPGVVVG